MNNYKRWQIVQTKGNTQEGDTGLKLRRFPLYPSRKFYWTVSNCNYQYTCSDLHLRNGHNLPYPPKATEQRCANISKSLKTKQTSCWNISQLPFRNKCPALTFLKLWQRQLPPQKGSGTVVFYPTQFKKIFFLKNSEILSCSCKADLTHTVHHKAVTWRYYTFLDVYLWISYPPQQKTKT